MTLDAIILLLILAATCVAFALEWMTIDVVAFTCLGALLAFDLVTPAEAVAGFSNPAVITVMMMFVLSDTLVQSGLVSQVGHKIASLSGRSHWTASIVLLVLCGGLSAFINNVAAVSILMPVAIQLSRVYGFSPSRILLPLSYAAIFGGTATLIGTSTNLLVSSLSDDHGLGAFSVFEFFPLGLCLFAIGLVYTVLVPMNRLPDRATTSKSLTRKYRLHPYLTELRVPDGSPLLGQTVVSEQISDRFGLTVLEILRGAKKIAVDIRNTAIEPDDVLLVRGAMEDIVNCKEHFRLLLLTDVKLTDEDLSDETAILSEVQLSPASRLVGNDIRAIDFRKRFGCFVLALGRPGGTVRAKITSVPLKPFDILLVFGPRARVEALHVMDDFMPMQELPVRLNLKPRWWVGATIVPLVVLLATFGVMGIMKAAILGVVAVLVTRSLTIQQAYNAINWTVIFLVACLIPLGMAMENTGLAAILGGAIAGWAEPLGPLGLLALIYLVTSVVTELISNNSTAIIMVPVAITAAESLQVAPKPFLMAVAFAASAAFLTPIGYKTNAMVYAPGGYRFTDYIKTGWPLKIVFWIVATALIPVFWSF